MCNQFEELQWYEIDIVVHVVENTSERKDIDGLWIDEGIEAISTDAIYKHADESKFTYYLGSGFGTDEPGWYSLTEGDINGKNYYKAPLPPGRWNITIDDGYGPYSLAYLDEFSIEKTHEHVVYDVILTKE